MAVSAFMFPWMPVWISDPEKVWWSWYDNSGSNFTHIPGLQVLASLTSGTPYVLMLFGPVPDPVPDGQLTLQLAILVPSSEAKNVEYTPRWNSGGADNETSDPTLYSEGLQSAAAHSGYTAKDFLIETCDLDHATPSISAGDRIFLKLELNSHADWPTQIVTIQPCLYWVA